MSDHSYSEIMGALHNFEETDPSKPRCVDIAPEPDQILPNTRVYLYTSKSKASFVPACSVGPTGFFCNVCYKYRGFESRKVQFQVESSSKKLVFGQEGDASWLEEGVWLLVPRKSLGQKYFVTCANKAIRPAPIAVRGDQDNLICKAEVPEGVGTLKLELSAAVTLNP